MPPGRRCRSTTSSPDAFRSCSRVWLGWRRGSRAAGVRLLGVAARERLPNLPNLPAINETVPGAVSSGWIVLMAPAGTPEPITAKVNADLRKVIAVSEVVERFQTLGTYTRDLSPAQTGEFIASEERLWWPIVRQVNQNR
jgi:tripartite-type tricarboxylate transporter receptor subunit TctC